MSNYAELPSPPSPFLLLPSRAAAIRRSHDIADLANDYLYSQSGHLIRARRNVCQVLRLYRESGGCTRGLINLLVREKRSLTEKLQAVRDRMTGINEAMAEWGLDGAGRTREEEDDE